jgi:hypothetical protein
MHPIKREGVLKRMWRHSLNTLNVFIVFHYYFNNVFVQIHTKESQKLQKVNIRMGAKRAVMKKRRMTHIQVKIVMKRRNQT